MKPTSHLLSHLPPVPRRSLVVLPWRDRIPPRRRHPNSLHPCVSFVKPPRWLPRTVNWHNLLSLLFLHSSTGDPKPDTLVYLSTVQVRPPSLYLLPPVIVDPFRKNEKLVSCTHRYRYKITKWVSGYPSLHGRIHETRTCTCVKWDDP